ncbi:CHAT domain-containing protein [Amycolatopsis thermophila]|uniref:Tetratricopeptide (TPR) repeat protein n=1 Tax=Amycolatopsis thermophila TaxID=206084 RepID=A0ABU0ESN1_9PSEU|nr:CHAT domain-containing tetratricopeptide repeat protein [Amycolatopsis thermophila]MDQ0377827.1 tetratricopeptide (TPR) repeat protein [Amycolatopsis thermophila]
MAGSGAASGVISVAAELHRRAADASGDFQNVEAVRLLTRALKRLDAGDPADPDWIVLRTRILISLALAEAEVGSAEAGFAHLDEAARLPPRLPDGPRRRELAIVVEAQRALVLGRIGRFAEAVKLFDSIVPALERDLEDNALPLTRNLMNRALMHVAMTNSEAALADLRRCLQLAVDHGLTRIEGKVRHNLGEHSQLIGDIPGALRHYEEAARIYRSAAPGWLPRLRVEQARALLAAGLADDAARHLDEVMPELRESRASQDIAEAEIARAAAAILDGDCGLARQLASAAHRRFRRRGNIPWAEVAALTRLRADATEILGGTRRPPAKLVAGLTRHADRLAGLGLRDEAAVARLLAVRLLLRRGEAAPAGDLLGRVPKPRRTTPIDHVMLLRLCRAELAVATGRPRAALAQARGGFAELSLVRDRMGGLDLVCGTAVHGQELGRLAVGLVLANTRGHAGARRLFAWQERTRAQVYRYEPLPAIDDPVLARLITEMRQVQRLAQQNRLDGKPVTALEQRYARLQREAGRLGWYTSPWGRPRPVSSPEEVAAELGDRVLVSLFGQDGELSAVTVRDGRFRLVRLGGLDEVVEITKQLHADLNALAPDHLPPPLVAAVTASAEKRASMLDERLVRPLAEVIGDRELVIVPTGPLYALPWSALPSLRGRPLSVAPSATAWVTAVRRESIDPVVLVGGPGVPGAIGEVKQLRSVYPKATLVDGPAATSSAVLEALDGAGLAHLVAHGAHEPANALFSRLELVDGPLFAHETARLRRPPDRVVLAACELAMSHIRPGEEALGFAGALLASGSRTVVGAIARVGDRAAAEAMADLHRRLASGTPPARALAHATAADPLRRPFLVLGAG